MPIIFEGPEPRAGSGPKAASFDVKILDDCRQSDLRLRFDHSVMAPDGQKRSGKSVQSFSALTVLTIQKMAQQRLERLERDKIG